MKETKPVTVIVRLTEKQAQILHDLAQGTTKSEALRRLLTQAAMSTKIDSPQVETKEVRYEQ